MSAPRTILITGATDGIGLELARIYQARGDRLVLIGRRPGPELDQQLFGPLSYCQVDLTQPDAAERVVVFMRQQALERLDLLIHSAGIGSYGPLADQPADEIDALLDTNLRAPVALTHALLPLLAARQGRVVFIGSVASALPVADYAVYGASKAALAGFARSLRIELRGRVGVQVIHPGATRTDMHAKIGAPLQQIGWRRFPLPGRVARAIVRAIDAGAAVATIGAGSRLLRFVGRHLGGVVDRVAMRRGA